MCQHFGFDAVFMCILIILCYNMENILILINLFLNFYILLNTKIYFIILEMAEVHG